MELVFVSFWALVTIFVVAQISGWVFGIRSNRYYSYFHFLGGFFMTLLIVGLTDRFLISIILMMAVGILWEWWEWLLWRFFLKEKRYKPEAKDTRSDLILDLTGGLAALFVLMFLS